MLGNKGLYTTETSIVMTIGGYIVYGVGHQFPVRIASTLHGEDGKKICSSITIYGKGNVGYIVRMLSCYPQSGAVKIYNGETVKSETNYNNTLWHSGVLGNFYILLADQAPNVFVGINFCHNSNSRCCWTLEIDPWTTMHERNALYKGECVILELRYSKCIKYICDYFHKGHGQATSSTTNEIEKYIGARYLGPIESSWSIFGNLLHNSIPTNLDDITSKDRSEYPQYRRRETRRRSILNLREPGRIRFSRENTNCGINAITSLFTVDESSLSTLRDACISVEKKRLTYYRIKQKIIRVQMYSGLTDLPK